MKYEMRTKKQENPLCSFLKRNRSIIPRYRKSRGSQHSHCREQRLHFFWLREQSFDLKILVLLCALRQYAEQIVIQPRAVGFCRFHQRINDCTRLRTIGCMGKELSLPTNDKRADGVFNLVIADFNLTMFKKRTEMHLLILSIRNSVLQLARQTGNCRTSDLGVFLKALSLWIL